MKCSEFLARFSEFFDGDPDLPEREAFRDHVESCPRCAHYTRVVREGGEEFRSLPRPSVRGDFWPRLQHRLYHVDDEERLQANAASSATPAAAVALVAVIVAAAAWYPALHPDEDASVDMPVIVVHEPPSAASTDGVVTPTSDSALSDSPSEPLPFPEFEPPGFYDDGPTMGPDGMLFPGPRDDLPGGRLLQADHR